MNSRIRRPLYIFPLNPDYVAARSLRSLRSNKAEVLQMLPLAVPFIEIGGKQKITIASIWDKKETL